MTWGTRRALIIIFLLIVIIGIGVGVSMVNRVPSRSVLVLRVEGTIEEQRPMDIFSAFSGDSIPVTHDFTDELDTARTDPRISALVVRVGLLSTGWAKLEEIRSHILSFRSSGKPSICFLGGDGIGNPEIYVASACQQVWLVPTDPVDIRGMMAESTFLRGSLDKLHIIPDYYHIAEYKTAPNQLTEKKFTPAHRDEVQTLLGGIYNQYLTDVSQARGMDRAQFEKLLNSGPLSADEALSSKLVDKLAYWDQVREYVREKAGRWRELDWRQYRSRVKNRGMTEIAVVHATGLIISGDSGNTPGGGFIMGGDSVASDLRKARGDPSVKAIVLRIDSGGGSAVASEVIRREVELAKGVKPVVVSMSDVAASGGYWIAMSANKIVAEPDTITASIGVFIGKLNVSGFMNMLGISSDYVATSDNATLFSFQQDFTPAQREWIQKSLQETYGRFTQGVAAGRKMSVADVDKIGKGRVWTGAQAKGFGLVDELGGLDKAIEVAKELAQISPGTRVRIERFPREKTFFELLMDRDQDDSARTLTLESILKQAVGTPGTVQARMPFDLTIR